MMAGLSVFSGGLKAALQKDLSARYSECGLQKHLFILLFASFK
jgi:hypothetical protein